MTAEQVIVGSGTATTAGSVVVGWIAQAQPIVAFCATLTGFVVGVLTAVYTYHRIQDLRARRPEDSSESSD